MTSSMETAIEALENALWVNSETMTEGMTAVPCTQFKRVAQDIVDRLQLPTPQPVNPPIPTVRIKDAMTHIERAISLYNDEVSSIENGKNAYDMANCCKMALSHLKESLLIARLKGDDL